MGQSGIEPNHEVKDTNSYINMPYDKIKNYIEKDAYEFVRNTFLQLANGAFEVDHPTMISVVLTLEEQGLCIKDSEVIGKILTVADKDENRMFNFEEFIRIFVSLVKGKTLADECSDQAIKKHVAMYICADTNYDQRVSISEICNMYHLLDKRIDTNVISDLLRELGFEYMNLTQFVVACRKFDSIFAAKKQDAV